MSRIIEDVLRTSADAVFSPPHSSYALSALPNSTQNYGTAPSGIIGQHYPKEIIRVERDWSDGEVCQFHSSYPMELEGRVSRFVRFHAGRFDLTASRYR